MFKSTLTRKHLETQPVKQARYWLPNRTDARYRASASRLQRAGPQWRPITDTAILSHLTVLEAGGKERPVITRSQRHIRSKFWSRKSGLLQKMEGWGEHFLALRNETDPFNIDWQAHPFKYEGIVKLPLGSKKFRYFPDCVRQSRGGPVELIEVKRSDLDLRDPFYREKLAEVKEACRRWGWIFTVLTEDEIMEPDTPLMSQMVSVFGRAGLELTPEEEAIAAELLAFGAPIQWADFSDAVAPSDPLQGDLVIEHLLGNWRLATPLNVRFSPQTLLEPVPAFTGKARFRL